MSNQIVKALEHGAEKLGKTLAEDAGKALKNLYRHAGDNLRKVAKNVREIEEKHVKDLEKILKGEGKGGLPHPRSGGGGRSGKGGPLGRGGRRGQAVDGNIGCRTAGDPVDVVSGQVITAEVDLTLAGLLPVVLRRSYASGYVGGRLFGQGWSSTLDQRVEIDASGVHFAGDDAQILHYPLPPSLGATVRPDAGAAWPLHWDADGAFRIEDPDTGLTRHFPPPAGNPGTAYRIGETRPLAAITDRNGHRISFSYDEQGAPREVTHSCGYRVAVDTAPSADGPRIEEIRLLDGARQGRGTTVTGYQYYPDGSLAGVVNSSGLPYVYEYDEAGRMTAWIDRNGHSYEYAYDEEGRVVSGTGTDGLLAATFQYDPAARVTLSTDSLGHTTAHHYDEQHRVTRVVDPLGHTTSTEYDPHGRVLARTDELGRTTRFQLDRNGDPTRLTAPDGSELTLRHTELRQIAAIVSNGRVIAEFGYAPAGNLLRRTDAAGAVTVRTHDGQGRLRSVTDPLGQTHLIETDPAGLITKVTDALGQTATVEYDAFGRVIATTDPLGGTTRYTRRVEGQITERRRPDGTVETWTFDAEGNATEQRDASGAVLRFETGPFGRIRRQVLADGEVQVFGYDTELRLTSVATGDAVWQYRYDRAGHLVGERDFNGRTLAYRKDGADQLLATTDRAGRTTAFAYDPLGRLTERRDHDGTTTALSYDRDGHLTAMTDGRSTVRWTHDAAGRVLTEDVDGRITRYTYDLLGRRTSRTTPTGLVSTWTWDAGNQPARLAGTLQALTFSHDPAGRETTSHIGAGAALTQSWDGADRLVGQSIWARSDTGGYTGLRERTYRYRADGMPETITDSLRGTRTLTLTPAGRVTEVRAENWRERYTYDTLGNITHAHDSRRPQDATAGERAYTGSLLRTAGRTGYDYDDHGRLTRRTVRTLSGQRREWHYQWDGQDRLVRLESPEGRWAYGYDVLGRRTSKHRLADDGQPRTDTEQTWFSWDGTQLAEQRTRLPGGAERTVSWDWEPGSWRAVAQSERLAAADGTLVEQRFHAIVTDLVDAPSELVSPDGRITWSADTTLWGRRLRRADGGPDCPLGRPGQYHDEESGLEYNYFRYYDPATGRYLSTDPLGQEAGVNPHGYVPNPLYWTDPLGLAKQPSGRGGWYNKLKPANWTDGSDNTSYEINHIPAKATYLGLGTPDLKESSGPSIRMEYDDHRTFISTGSSAASDRWRAKQTSLIQAGKFDEAMKMDIDEIRRVHGTKYDAAIKEMVDSLPDNKKFQKFLSGNGWSIRTCLLK
ncbi:RHS repeat-associated core domain-containing protein [Kitasatospora sp. NPDC059646]|uniref:RHS repeat-associated core domain-containing protein n=1 Tax=Kitasatospora sp. NPDC059646 TaxID=3346893 RepID=UPI0036771D87